MQKNTKIDRAKLFATMLIVFPINVIMLVLAPLAGIPYVMNHGWEKMPYPAFSIAVMAFLGISVLAITYGSFVLLLHYRKTLPAPAAIVIPVQKR